MCILTPWFFHPVSLWHWDHRLAAWQLWLSAWYGPTAGQTFPVLCGEGSHTSVAIPARVEEERFGPSHQEYFKTSKSEKKTIHRNRSRRTLKYYPRCHVFEFCKFVQIINEVIIDYNVHMSSKLECIQSFLYVFPLAAAMNLNLLHVGTPRRGFCNQLKEKRSLLYKKLYKIK